MSKEEGGEGGLGGWKEQARIDPDSSPADEITWEEVAVTLKLEDWFTIRHDSHADRIMVTKISTLVYSRLTRLYDTLKR